VRELSLSPPPSTKSDRLAVVALTGVLVSSLVALFATGNAALAIVPVVVATGLYFAWTQPMRRIVLPIIFAQCFFFAPPTDDQFVEHASGPLWTMILRPGNLAMNIYLNKVVGVSALSLTGQELLYPLLMLLLLIRFLRGDRIDATERQAGSSALYMCLAVALATVLWLEVLGAATGGNMRSTLFQIRMFLWIPLETLVISLVMRDLRDFRSLAATVTLAAILKVAFGLFFVIHDVWSRGETVPWMTGHQDSVLYVGVIFGWFAAWIHERTWRRFLVAGAIIVWIGIGIYVNNRRIAYVSLVGTLLAFYPLIDGTLKRRVNLTLIAASPLIVLYLLLATTHSTGIFAPGASLMGIAKVTDGSTQWRELENSNLIYTLRQNRLFGWGWGHEYLEVIKLPDVSQAYKEYRLMAHNSVLWLLGLSGIVGFTMLWAPLVAGVYLAARSYQFARNDAERTAAATAIGLIVCYVNQAWGDIGVGLPIPTLLLACALALSGKLARITGAWPARAKLFGAGGTVEASPARRA